VVKGLPPVLRLLQMPDARLRIEKKSISRAKVENAFDEVLKRFQPTAQLFELAKAMLQDAWDMRLGDAQGARAEWERQIKETEKQIEGILDRIVDAANPAVVVAYEKRLAKLEREKILLAEKSVQGVPLKGRLEEIIELSHKFLASPWYIYKNGEAITRQIVLRLVFSEPLRYCRKEGYGTPKTSFPFRMLGGILGSESEMVL